MTGENWTDILYDSMHSQEHASVTCAALFIVFIYFAVHCNLPSSPPKKKKKWDYLIYTIVFYRYGPESFYCCDYGKFRFG